MNWALEAILEWRRVLRLAYVPPLMIYMAAGISGLTNIVGTFYVKERLGLSAEFLAVIGFWAGLPWAIKMPLGHLVDLMWRWKSIFVFIGAGLMAGSLLIMVGLIGYPQLMAAYASQEAWYVFSVILGPTGFVLQDVVADAMTVEAVPAVDNEGNIIDKHTRKVQHTTMQTLGRIAMISGGIAVALLNVFLMAGVSNLPIEGKTAAYLLVYQLSLTIPIISVFGVPLAWLIKRNNVAQLVARGYTVFESKKLLETHGECPSINWWILGGGCLFAILSITIGLSSIFGSQEIIFSVSLGIIVFMLMKLMRELSPDVRGTILGIAVIVFTFRAVPGPGAGSTWWMIDELKFDQEFLAKLDVTAEIIALVALFAVLAFGNIMAKKSLPFVLGCLTVLGTLMALPIVGMYYGLHEWTAAYTNGIVGARTIALVDTALQSPLGEVAMVPMLAWIANSAPPHLKATFFAVFASFSNLAHAAAELGTKYLNQIYTVTREVRDAGGVVQIPADYSELGMLLMASTIIGFILPMATIIIFRRQANRKIAVS